jgi:tetratricopeptide (TPR) repeat protein
MNRGVPVEVCLFTNVAQQFEALLETLSAEEILVVDLSVGSLEGFSAARQLASQLDIDLAYSIFGRPINQSSSPSERVAAWVDAEGRGDSLVEKAYSHAAALAATSADLDADFLVILPFAGEKVCEEDNWFLYFLAAALNTDSRALRFCSPDELPEDFALHGLDFRFEAASKEPDLDDLTNNAPALLSVMPGLLKENQVVQLATEGILDEVALLPLMGGTYLIAPAHRRRIEALSDEELCVAHEQAELITENEAVIAGLSVSKLERGLAVDHPIADLVAAAWRLCGEGGLDVAERFFTVIAAHLKDHSYNDYLRVAVEMQSFRISAQRFDLAATLEEPDTEIGDAQLCEDVYFTLGWARVLGGNPEGAAEAFARAGSRDLKSAENAIDLYLLNIFALSLLRNGDWEGAMKIEAGINRRLALLPAPDWHLHYINNFNLARLYRMRGDYDSALTHVRAVLATTEGLQTDSDHIYFNLTLGDLAARRDYPKDAIVYFWRAAVNFLCNPVPEAIGWRTLMSVRGRRESLSAMTPDLVAKGLCLKLEQAATKANIALSDGESSIPFYYSEQGLSLDNQACRVIASSQLDPLIMSPEDPGRSGYDSCAYRRLRSIVIQIFESISSEKVSMPVGSIMFTPVSRVELLPEPSDQVPCLALKYGLVRSSSESSETQPFNLSEAVTRISVRLAPAVSAISSTPDGAGALVSFKRYKDTLELRGWAPRLIFMLRDTEALNVADAIAKEIVTQDETGFRGLGHQLGRLESQGVIEIRCD